MGRWLEKWLGLMLVSASLIWAAYHTIQHGAFSPGFMRLGPMQALMAGLMLWLHGKFRNASTEQPSARH